MQLQSKSAPDTLVNGVCIALLHVVYSSTVKTCTHPAVLLHHVQQLLDYCFALQACAELKALLIKR